MFVPMRLRCQLFSGFCWLASTNMQLILTYCRPSLGCDFFEHSCFLHLHKTVLNFFSFAGPCFVFICVFVAKKVISLDGRTFTHYKVTIFYLCICKF